MIAGVSLFTENGTLLFTDYTICKSHPSRVRGLKLVVWVNLLRYQVVAPLAGAWIETSSQQ